MSKNRLAQRVGLLLLLLLAVGGLGGAVSASVPVEVAPQAPITRLIANEVLAENLRFGGFFTPDAWVDSAGNKFTAYVRNGFEEPFQAAAVIRKVAPDGTLLHVYEVLASRAGKADGVDITPTGSNLLVTLTSHAIGGADPRGVLGEKLLEGVFAPYTQGTMPAGAPGAFTPSEVQACPEIDYTRIENNQRAESNRVISEIKLALPQIIRTEIANSNVLTLDNIYASHGLFARIHETAYLSAMEAIRDSRVHTQP